MPSRTTTREGQDREGGREGGREGVALPLLSWRREDFSSDRTAVQVVAATGQMDNYAIGVAEDGRVA